MILGLINTSIKKIVLKIKSCIQLKELKITSRSLKAFELMTIRRSFGVEGNEFQLKVGTDTEL